jgi:hypothetical protein
MTERADTISRHMNDESRLHGEHPEHDHNATGAAPPAPAPPTSAPAPVPPTSPPAPAPPTSAPEPPPEETVDGLPVLAEVRTIERLAPASLPVVQAAAAAATGFVAGAATLALVKRRSARKLTRARSGSRRAVDVLPIVGSRTFLVDVHLIGKQGE